MSVVFSFFFFYSFYGLRSEINADDDDDDDDDDKSANVTCGNVRLFEVFLRNALYKYKSTIYITAVKAGHSERMKKHVLTPLTWKG